MPASCDEGREEAEKQTWAQSGDGTPDTTGGTCTCAVELEVVPGFWQGGGVNVVGKVSGVCARVPVYLLALLGVLAHLDGRIGVLGGLGGRLGGKPSSLLEGSLCLGFLLLGKLGGLQQLLLARDQCFLVLSHHRDPSGHELALDTQLVPRALLDVDLGFGPRLDHRVDACVLMDDEQACAGLMARVGGKDDGERRRVHSELII